MRTNCSKSWQKKAVPSDSGQDTMPRDSCGSRRECRVIKSGGAESSAAQKKPCSDKIRAEKEKDGGGEGKYHYNAASGRQTDLCPSGILFGKVRCDKARAPSAYRLRQGRASVRRVVWRAGRYQRLPHRSGATGIFYRNPRILQMIPDAVRISVPRRSVFFLVIFSMG